MESHRGTERQRHREGRGLATKNTKGRKGEEKSSRGGAEMERKHKRAKREEE